MPLADDLLVQAGRLATVDTGVPLQANLRRSISWAYYALFHLLIDEVVRRLVPATPAGLRPRASRSFGHGELKQVCSRFVARKLEDDLVPLLGNQLSSQLLYVADTFILLQEERHLADYDVGSVFDKDNALEAVAYAATAIKEWQAIRNTDEANVFLTALAFGTRWSK